MATKPNNIDIQTIHHQSDVQLLDDIDRLRSHGISHYVALPQLVVCGDQSSGKSSVLEAISGIPFPTKDNLCTRFATEVILRRTSTEQLSVTISPGPGREKAEEAKLRDFQESLVELSRFGEVVEKAKLYMGLDDIGSAFTNDILRVDISGPDRPHLTIVDLPGLIHSHNKVQSTEDVQVVQNLVRRYMTSSRSIILAIVSAKNDYANQIVLKMAREVDPYGQRTLGIITKPDTLPAGSESETAFVNLAKNLDIPFQLGWHVLKNRDYEFRHSSLEDRDRQEINFLSQGTWSQLARSMVAIGPLRPRLSKILLTQIKRELPAVIDEVEQRLAECRTELRKLGQRRQTPEEQQRYLLHLAQEYQNLARAAIDGVYGDPFFGDPRTDLGYARRIRAKVQNLSLEFAETMRQRGHRYQVGPDMQTTDSMQATAMSRNEYLEHAKVLLTRSRGRELPGTFNPLLIAELFHEQSVPWRGLAHGYVETVWTATRSFLESAVLHLTQEETADNIIREIVDPIMEQRIHDMSKAVDLIIDQYQEGHPVTYNHYFTETIQNVRAKRMEDDLTQRLRNFMGDSHSEALEELHFDRLKKSSLISALSIRNETDMDRFACAEAVDCMFAFYKVAMKAVVDNIATQCIENQLLKPLPGILSPATVIEMDITLINKVAEESAISTDLRDGLLRKVQMLESGLDTCRRHATVQRPIVEYQSKISASSSYYRKSNSNDNSDTENDDNERHDNVHNSPTWPIYTEHGSIPKPEDVFSFGSNSTFSFPATKFEKKSEKGKKKKSNIVI